MEFKTWNEYWPTFSFLVTILLIIELYLDKQERQALKQGLNDQDTRTPQERLDEYKSNLGHRFLTRSERRFREHLFETSLKATRSQDRSRFHSKGTGPVVRGHPAIKKFSRMNRQLRQPSLPKSYNWHQLRLLFNQLCIYTALPLLTFCVLCHHLRINLTEPFLLEDSDDAEAWELDPV